MKKLCNYDKMAQRLGYANEHEMWVWLYTICHLGPCSIGNYLNKKNIQIHPETIRSRIERSGIHRLDYQEHEDAEYEYGTITE